MGGESVSGSRIQGREQAYAKHLSDSGRASPPVE